ncbi:hypothetical protein ACFQY4_17530 [Catellatospora bangladeshensis]|uniref:Uncharacterized protein n=1 Tax=Catellatospora bangladeshensis TaxID=310355 RepID=A0A8J3NNF2_9ACTN|nr:MULTISPECIES: hypothetical protein [Catellatospora]BCJ75906.1 hypothetical protein CS0771_54500 [Catellatospora sp. IY07-71]GIF86261.1 hypothetical protein Cba03nite_76100 [Catellatospora bangladeshensis]
MTNSDNEWVASLPFSSGTSFAGRLAMLGGTLALTEQDLTFTPLIGLGRIRRFALADIESVAVHADKPPRLRIALKRGSAVVLMVTSSRATPVWSQDASARDEAIMAINARLAGS